MLVVFEKCYFFYMEIVGSRILSRMRANFKNSKAQKGFFGFKSLFGESSSSFLTACLNQHILFGVLGSVLIGWISDLQMNTLWMGCVALWWLALSIFYNRKILQIREEKKEKMQQIRTERKSQESEFENTLGNVFARCAEEFQTQMVKSEAEVDQVKGLLHEAIKNLVSSFTTIDAQAQLQQKLAATITHGHSSGKEDGLEHFIAESTNSLALLVASTEKSSKDATQLVDKLEQISNEIAGVQSLLGEIDAISMQTRLLALNATIQAGKAGEAGKGFAVVANEIREMSGRTNQFSQEIRKTISQTQESVTATRQEISNKSSHDFRLALESQNHSDEMMSAAQQVNNSMGTAAEELATLTRSVEQNVYQAVTNLQFQDMVTQLLDHVRLRMESLTDVANKINTIASDLVLGAIEGRQAHSHEIRSDCDALLHLLEDVQQTTKRNPVKQESMNTGEIELF